MASTLISTKMQSYSGGNGQSDTLQQSSSFVQTKKTDRQRQLH